MLNYYTTDELSRMLKERKPGSFLVPKWITPIMKGRSSSGAIILYSVLLDQLLTNFTNNKELVDENDVRYITPNNDEIEKSLNESIKPFYEKLANHKLIQQDKERVYLLRQENWEFKI